MGHKVSTQICDSALVAKTATDDNKLIHGCAPIKLVYSSSLFPNYVFLITHVPTQNLLLTDVIHA